MKKCSKCNVKMKELKAETPEGIAYNYFKCEKCREEILSMSQLGEVAEKYRQMKKFHVKISKWGQSLGFRIPKELAKQYKFKEEKEVTIIPEKEGIKILPG